MMIYIMYLLEENYKEPNAQSLCKTLDLFYIMHNIFKMLCIFTFVKSKEKL